MMGSAEEQQAMYGGTDIVPDGDFMQNFIRQHMTLILRPTAEHVRESQNKIHGLSSDLMLHTARADDLHCAVGGLRDEHATLQSSAAATNAKLEKTSYDLVDVQAAHASLESDFHNVKAVQGATDARVSSSLNALELLREKVEGLDGSVQKLQLSAIKTTKATAEHGDSLTELRDFYTGVSYRQADTNKDLEQLTQVVMGLERSFKKHLSAYGQQHDEGVQSSNKLVERANSLFDVLGDTNRSLQALSDRHAAQEAQMAKIMEQLSGESANVAKALDMCRRVSYMEGLLEDQIEKVQLLEKSLDSLRKDFTAETRSNSALVHDIAAKVTSQGADLHVVAEVQGTHGDQIRKSDRCVVDLLKEQHALRGQTENLERDAVSTNSFKADALNRLESHTRSLQRKADLEVTTKDLDDVNQALQSVKQQLLATNSNVSKLTMRFDSCNKNLHGLSRGFEDVHRHVVLGEQGMLPPRGADHVEQVQALSRPNTARGLGGGGGNLPSLRPSTATPSSRQQRFS